jgi:hypothetical protein
MENLYCICFGNEFLKSFGKVILYSVYFQIVGYIIQPFKKKKQELLLYDTMWTNLGNVMLIERRQIQKATWFCVCEMSKIGKSKGTVDEWLLGAKAGVGMGNECWWIWVSLEVGKNISELGDRWKVLWVYEKPMNCTCQNVIVAQFLFYLFSSFCWPSIPGLWKMD